MKIGKRMIASAKDIGSNDWEKLSHKEVGK
jgi:hypothetical protein